MKRILLLTGLACIVAAALYLAGPRILRGDLLSGDDIAWNLKQRSDSNHDGILTPSEIRSTLSSIVRHVIQEQGDADINGDGAVNRADIVATTRAFRALLIAVCGNNRREAGEQCDDGNVSNADTCSSICLTQATLCGNGSVDSGESCDDGNTADADGCSAMCTQSILWYPKTLGLQNWYDTRSHCQQLVWAGWTYWNLPTLAELELIKPEIQRIGLTGQVWTSVHGPIPNGPTMFRTWNTETGVVGEAADAEQASMFGLCVRPSSIFQSCTDGDRPAGTISYDTYIRSAIFTKSNLRRVQGTQETVTEDTCNGNTLREQLCPFVVGQGNEVSIDCPYGCTDGACFRDPPQGFAWPYPATVSSGTTDPNGTAIGTGMQALGSFTIHSTDPIDITQMTFSIDLQNVRLRSMSAPDENQIRRQHITVTTNRTGLDVALTCSDADSLDEIIGPGVRRLRCSYGGSVPTRVGPSASTTFTLHGELIPVPGASNPMVTLSWRDFNDPFFKPDSDIGMITSESNVRLMNRRAAKQQYYLPALQAPTVTSTRYSVVP